MKETLRSAFKKKVNYDTQNQAQLKIQMYSYQYSGYTSDIYFFEVVKWSGTELDHAKRQ